MLGQVPPEFYQPSPPEEFAFDWDNEKVRRLKVPVTRLAVARLAWNFDAPLLTGNVSLRDVLANPGQHPEHTQRILKADTRYPLDVMFHKGRWMILDGMHRLAKLALLCGARQVRVRRIPESAIPKIAISPSAKDRMMRRLGAVLPGLGGTDQFEFYKNVAKRYAETAARLLDRHDLLGASKIASDAEDMIEKAYDILRQRHPEDISRKDLEEVFEVRTLASFVQTAFLKETNKLFSAVFDPPKTPIRQAIHTLVDAETAVKDGDLERAKRLVFESTIMARTIRERSKNPDERHGAEDLLTRMVPAMIQAIKTVEAGGKWVTPE